VNTELVQTDPELPDWGPYMGERPPYGSERCNTGVKGPHRSERASCIKEVHEGEGAHRGEFKQDGGQKYFLTHPLLSHFQNDGATI